MNNYNLSFVFFGTGPLAESVLAALVRNGYIPKLIITKPDSLQGRHMVLTAPYIKTWGEMKGIPVLQPVKLDSEFIYSLQSNVYSLFIVASYGKILPDQLLSIPKHGVLNVHPSLLPQYRGPSPIESALLDGVDEIGLSIMKLDKDMDHGPILVQNVFKPEKEATALMLEVTCGQLGGELLSQVLPHYINGTLIPKEQDHTLATFCKKITKEQGEVTLSTSTEELRKKYRALTPWPGLYFFITHHDKQVRIKITNVDLTTHFEETSSAQNAIISVTPEGKNEMDFDSFKRGYSI
jgi:methionyl-tRNA formyltransferase